MRGRQVSFTDFAGGLDLVSNPVEMPADRSPDATNTFVRKQGVIEKVGGSSVIVATGGPTYALIALPELDKLLWTEDVAGNGKIKERLGATGVVTDRTGALLLTAAARMSFLRAGASGGQGPIYGMNGFQAVQWSGAAANAAAWTAATGTLPIARYLALANNRVWAASPFAFAGLVDPRSAVFWSDPGDPRGWPAANVNQFSPNDGEEVTGIATVGSYVIVFKPSGVWAIYDLDTGANRQISSEVGAVSHRSLASDGERVYFLTRDRGVYVTNGNEVKPVPNVDLVMPQLLRLKPDVAYQAHAAVWEGRLYLDFPDSQAAGSMRTLMEFDPVTEAWWRHELGNGFNQLAVFQGAGMEKAHLWGAHVGPPHSVVSLFQDGIGTDPEGVVLQPHYVTSQHDLGRVGKRKRIHQIALTVQGEVGVEVLPDNAIGGTGQGMVTPVSSAPTSPVEFPTPPLPVGRSFGFRFYGTNDETFRVLELRADVLDRRD